MTDDRPTVRRPNAGQSRGVSRRCRTGPTRPGSVVLVAAAALLWAVAAARAADPTATNTISVSGSATVKGRPTSVVISGTLTGEAELAADASVKFGDQKKKVMGILTALKNPDLAIESQGSTIEQGNDPAMQQRIMNGMGGGEGGKPKVRITEQWKLVLRNADKQEPEKLLATVLKTIDAARDAGLQVGPPTPRNYYEMQMMSQNGGGLASFKIADISDMQDQAYKAAVEDARHRAQRLADLSGVKLGRIVSAQDLGAGGSSENRMVYYGYNNSNDNPPVNKEASSNALTEIPVTARVSVQFEIAK